MLIYMQLNRQSIQNALHFKHLLFEDIKIITFFRGYYATNILLDIKIVDN